MDIDLFDGHCDTVLKCRLLGGGFGANGYHVDLERGRAYRRYAQFFALFGQPEDFPDLTARETFEALYGLFSREMEANAGDIAHCRTAAEAENPYSRPRCAADHPIGRNAVNPFREFAGFPAGLYGVF